MGYIHIHIVLNLDGSNYKAELPYEMYFSIHMLYHIIFQVKISFFKIDPKHFTVTYLEMLKNVISREIQIVCSDNFQTFFHDFCTAYMCE
jgi:ABC-type sugar transport system permease subunit